VLEGLAMSTWEAASNTLVELLQLEAPPIALSFTATGAALPPFDGEMSEPTQDDRTGRVPASCVFWAEAEHHGFSTVAADHGNCSVGKWVHGFASLDDISGAADVAALFESGWITSDAIETIETIDDRPDVITYQPLSETLSDPEVVLLRLNPRQMMELMDALPQLELSRKPQCQIIARAKAGRAAASMGCALSRERTGMPDGQLTCALPASDLTRILDALTEVSRADTAVRRFASSTGSTVVSVRA
jgi:uncharacterized protein (DUF169 family)